MKTKTLVIIFILFLLITLGSGLVVFLTGEKGRPILNETSEIINFSSQPAIEGKQGEIIKNKPVLGIAAETKPVVQTEKTALPEAGDGQVEQIQAAVLINGVEYRTAVKPDSSVYDLMNLLKTENKINFSGKNYSGLGFFIEAINGVKNNSAGKNWLYYVNGQPAQIGISNYIIKENDIIEWKYEKKLF